MRRQSRELAVQILFQTEFAPQISVHQLVGLYDKSFPGDVTTFAETLVTGTLSHKEDIDGKIQSCSSHWKVDRMSSVDRNILRLAVFELCFASEKIKENILINEAIEIAKKFGNTESAGFVNGILDQVARTQRQ